MNVQPRLVLDYMDMAQMDAMGTKSFRRIRVELWKELGLCMHQDDPMLGSQSTWVISHHISGRRILKNIWDRKEAMDWLMKLRVVLSDWRLPHGTFMNMVGKEPIVEQVLSMQQEIDGGINVHTATSETSQ